MKKLIVERRFKYAPAQVFDAFASAEALGSWWGPAGMQVVVLKYDFRPGGWFHYTMETGREISYGLMEFLYIERPHEIQWLNSFADENGAKIKPPFAEDFPLEIHNTLSLKAEGSGTLLTITGVPYKATASGQQFFENMFDSMHEGFGGTLDQLLVYLQSSSGN